MARLSATALARLRCRTSCSMQKYGVSNSSGSRMTWAPRAAAARTRLSAFAILAPISQPHDICVAATVTRRDAAWKCSGSADIEHLPGVENATRVERGFQRSHGGDLSRAPRNPEVRLALQ